MMENRKIKILSPIFVFIATMSIHSSCTVPGVSCADKARFVNYCHFAGKNRKDLSYAEMISSFELGLIVANDMTRDNELRNNETMRNLFKYKLWVDSPVGHQNEKIDQKRHALAHLVAGPAAFAIVDNSIDYVSGRLMQTGVAKDLAQIMPEKLCIQKEYRDFLYTEGKFIFSSVVGVAATIKTEGNGMDEQKIKDLGVRVTTKVGSDLVEQFIIAPFFDKIMGTEEKESFKKDVVKGGLVLLALVGIRQIARLDNH
jgi:hypothetical protein